MTILGIEFSDLEVVLIVTVAWLIVCLIVGWITFARGGQYEQPDHDGQQAEFDEEFASLSRARREEIAARFK